MPNQSHGEDASIIKVSDFNAAFGSPRKKRLRLSMRNVKKWVIITIINRFLFLFFFFFQIHSEGSFSKEEHVWNSRILQKMMRAQNNTSFSQNFQLRSPQKLSLFFLVRNPIQEPWRRTSRASAETFFGVTQAVQLRQPPLEISRKKFCFVTGISCEIPNRMLFLKFCKQLFSAKLVIYLCCFWVG